MEDPFEILELSKDATPAQIRKAFQKMTIKYYPKNKGGDTDMYFKVRAAYESITKSLVFIDQYNNFKNSYLDSNDEITDLIKIYNKHKGMLKKIIDDHILSEYVDEDRIRAIIDKLIEEKKVRKFKNYENRIPDRLKKKKLVDIKKLMGDLNKNDEKRVDFIAMMEQKYCNKLKK